MAASDARPIPRKNTAYRVTFPLLDADGDLVTGAASLDSEVSKDGGAFADCTNEATEIATSSGIYYLDLTADEMNADTVAIIVKTSTSGAKTTPIVLYPEELGDVRVNVGQWNGTAVPSEHTAGYPVVTVKDGTGTGEIDTASGRVAITEAQIDQIVDEVWDEDATAHQTQGTFGQAIGDPGADADTIWALVNTNLNATVGSRATQSSVDTLTTYVDTEVAAIKAKTDQLTFTSPNKIDASLQAAADLAAAVANKIADHVRRRTQANVEASGDGDALDLSSEYGLIQQAQESSVSGGTMTVRKTDGATTLGTKTVTTSAGAEPITGVS